MALSGSYLVGKVETDAVAVGESADFWVEHVCRNQGTLRFRFESAATFHGSMAVQRLADYQLVGSSSDGIVYSRTRTDIRRDDDASLRLFVPTAGPLNLRQEDRAVEVLPGQAALITKSRPADFGQPLDTQSWIMNIPQGALAFDHAAGPALIDVRQGLGAVAVTMMSELSKQRGTVDALSFATACDMITDLFRLCLRPGEESPTTLGSVDAAVRDYVRRHATDPELTPAVIAHNLGWSLRQVQLALQSADTTPSQLIRTERLAHARRLLRESRAERTVAEIAFASGFRSLSAFGVCFKTQFGITPQEARTF